MSELSTKLPLPKFVWQDTPGNPRLRTFCTRAVGLELYDYGNICLTSKTFADPHMRTDEALVSVNRKN
jgi:hypothetical protein